MNSEHRFRKTSFVAVVGCFTLAGLTSAFAQEPSGQVIVPHQTNPTAVRRATAGTAKPRRSKSGSTAAAQPPPDSAIPSSADSASEIPLNVDDRVEEAIEKGSKARDDQNFVEAESQYRRALVLNPNEARAYYGLGNTFFDQEHYDDAVAAYGEATRLKSDYAEAFNDLGFVYAKQKRYTEAIENYKRAIAIKPDLLE